MKKNYDIVLFDLDGTLSESGEGIISSICKVLETQGEKIPDNKTLRKFIGPPMIDSLMSFCNMSRERSEYLTKLYREEYENTGFLKTKLYEGVLELLKDLKNTGVFISTATSRPEPSAIRALKNFEIYDYFDVVVASPPENPQIPKRELIKEAISEYNKMHKEEKSNLKVAMVGDTYFDMNGAKQAGVTAIGVTYGYGTKDELINSGADILVNNIEELRGCLIK